MGLDISSKSHLQYHAGYGGLHYIRFMAYKFCGGPREFSTFEGGGFGAKEQTYDWCFIVACLEFPNLMMHSDAEGSYGRRGKVNPMNGALDSGSSPGLLRELERLEEFAKTFEERFQMRTDTYYMLLALVQDVVHNHDGRLELH